MTAEADALETVAVGKPPELVAAARMVVETIEGSDLGLEAAMKWGAITFALHGDFHHWICSVGVTRKRVNLTFHFGGILEDPDARLLAGSSKLLRRLEYTGVADVDRDELLGFVEQAVGQYPYFKEHWRELT